MGYRQYQKQVFRADNYQCVYCGSKDNLSLDHLWPQSLGGNDNLLNLVTACRSCNSRKNNRMLYKAKMIPMFGRYSYVKLLVNTQKAHTNFWGALYKTVLTYMIVLLIVLVLIKLIS